ncbi:MAG: hypothetical protein JXB62_18430 [Pirellulales bacterium]|nr:hypothetical protein [Pirellulales bacterium]
MEAIPRRFRREPGGPETKLSDLDEAAWDYFPDETITALSKVIIDRVAAYHVRKAFQHRHFPRPPEGIRLDDLPLENRTRRCLAREGFDDNPQALGDYTIGNILSIRAFGPRCLVDLLCALESPKIRGGSGQGSGLAEAAPSEALTAAAKRLAGLPTAKLVRCEDPRFSRLTREVDAEATTAQELAERLLVRCVDPPDPPYVAEQVRQLARRIEGMPDLTLEEELIQIFGSTPYERNRKILVGYYGWADGRQHTLTEIGNQFGITRERIRQVCAKLTRRHKKLGRVLAPVMDRVLSLIDRRLPLAASEFEAEMAARGLTAIGMRLESVATGARLLDRPVTFKIVKLGTDRLVVRPEDVDAATAVVDVAKKEIYFHGLATVEKIEQAVSEKFPVPVAVKLVTAALPLIDGFSWLDQSSGWFRLLPIAKHGLPKAIDKILSVAGEVTIDQMRTAMSRNRRLWKAPPPENVLLEFCRQTPGVRVEDDRIRCDPPRDWRESLTGVEAKLVSVLKKHGPVMERGVMEDLCVAGGMNRFSFHAFVSWSPVIAQYGHSVYGLLGADVSQEQVDELIAKRRAKRLSHRVLDDHGRTEDGRIWLSYRLSKAASTYAVITIPAALKKVVRGRFALLDIDGEAIGTLATKDGRAWGLGAFMREQGAQIGDFVVVTLDLQQRTAVVELGPPPEP